MKALFRILTVIRGLLTFLMWLAIIGTVVSLATLDGAYLNFALSVVIWWLLRTIVTVVTNRVFIRAYRDDLFVQEYVNRVF